MSPSAQRALSCTILLTVLRPCTTLLDPISAAVAATHAIAAMHAPVTHAAASHAIAANAAAAAATGATGAAVAAPQAITKAWRGDRKPELRAIGRIVDIELDRLREEPFLGGEPVEVARRFRDTAVSRAPIISWGIDIWLRGSPMAQEALTQVGLKRAYDEVSRDNVPDFLTSLRVLERELASQVRAGITRAPLRVVRLLYYSALVTLCAMLARLPGFAPVRAGVRRRWPKLLNHLAATIESNHEQNLAEAPRGEMQVTLDEWKNHLEVLTGWDFDGDGYIGEPPAAKPAGPGSRLSQLLASLRARRGPLSAWPRRRPPPSPPSIAYLYS